MNRKEVLEQLQKNVEKLSATHSPEYQYIPLHQKPSPSVKALHEIMRLLRKIVFPGFFGTEQEAHPDSIQYYTGVYLEQVYDLVQEQVYNGLCFEKEGCCETKDRSAEIALAFIDQLPYIKHLLSTDVKAMLDGDPAANSPSEVIFCYPSILAMLHQRVAHQLYKLDVPILPRIITEMAHTQTGIDIHPGAQIGEYFSMDHGTGIVIGKTTIIGNHVSLYQGVTLGAKNFTFDDNGLPLDLPRHPVIEDHVTIYSNTSILGRITIGEGSIIGGNIWLTHDVPPFSKITQTRAIREDWFYICPIYKTGQRNPSICKHNLNFHGFSLLKIAFLVQNEYVCLNLTNKLKSNTVNRISTLSDLTTFYDSLHSGQSATEPQSVVQVKVSMATCGIAAGAKLVMDELIDSLKKEQVEVNISQTGCMGYCFAEPTLEVTLPGKEPVIFGHLNKYKVDDLVSFYIKQEVIPDSLTVLSGPVQEQNLKHKQVRIALRNCGFVDPENIDDYIRQDGYMALGKALTQMSPDQVIQEIIDSGLRGRGGGGFPTGLKWKITRQVENDRKYVVCNADEGDPGAFMDRSILEGDPHSIIEAMAINGFCTGANYGLVYIRAEYPLAIERLKIALKQAREYGFLGENILGTGFSFDIQIRYGAGAFVCGEETALIRSMEGLRGEATVKPPFPSEQGYKGFPTNVNNVETYANIPTIILNGPSWFNKIGTERSKGTKVFALAGKVNNVGLVEVPMGTTLREVIFDIGGGIKDGKKFKAVQTGGPSGGCLTEKHLDLPIDYDNLIAAGSMMGSGGMIVMDEDDCMVSVAQFYLDFTVEESCGKCAPCRIGNKRLHEILQKITTGKGTEDDLLKLRNLALVIKDTALCGLGQTSPNPVLSTMDNFYEEYEAHVRDMHCPAHQCPELTQYVINPDTCTGCTLCSRACPVNAIRGDRRSPHVIDPIVCIRCGACLEKCKFTAVYVV